jgi:hypothetical protein
MKRAVLYALLRRELSAGWLLLLIVLTALAVTAAWFRVDVAHTDLLSRMIRRADITLLAVVAALTAVHAAQRISADRDARWLEPYAAAGGPTRGYLLSILSAIVVARFTIVTAALSGFAIAPWVRSGSVELLIGLPLLVAQSALLLACLACYAACFALAVRDAVSAVLIALVTAAVPLALVSWHELRNAGIAVPLPLRAWVLCCTPPLHVADTLHATASDAAWLCAMLVVAALLARNAIGRHE